MHRQAFDGGFTDPPVDAAQAFRAAMNAMARPGEIHQIEDVAPPAPLSPAAGVLLLTLCDATTPVFLAPSHDTQAVRDWLVFHTGAPVVMPEAAAFALGRWQDLQPVAQFAIGTAQYPDRSATLIVELDDLSAAGPVLRGPGIRDQASLSLPDVAVFQRNAARYPLGLDFFFTCGPALAALPRSTKVEAN